MTQSREPLTVSYWPAQEHPDIWNTTVGDLLRQVTEEHPERVALVDGVPDPEARRSWTYAEFLAASERAAQLLLERFEPGERVALWAPNCAEWLIIRQGMAMAGILLVALNPAYRASELNFVLQQSGAAGLIHSGTYRGVDLETVLDEIRDDLPELREVLTIDEWAALPTPERHRALPEVRPTDPLQIQYTSGTTGFPKGAMLHHKGLINAARFVAERAGMQDGDTNVNAMPMYHIGGGAVTSFGALAYRGTFVVMSGFEPGLMLEALETHRGTHSLLVPTMLSAMLEHPDFSKRDLSSVKTVMSGASAVSAALVRRTKEAMGCNFSILFGQTEMHGVTNQTRITDSAADQADTVGQPLPDMELKIADPVTGEPVPIGTAGEICCRGYTTMLEYFRMPEATAATIDDEGWLHMGDLGVMDERGFVRITGRMRDMIIRGGINIYPAEIENFLSGHPAIADVAVIGVPDEEWGEQIAAVVRLHPDTDPPSPDDLRAFCRTGLSAHKAPLYWSIVTQLPMTPTGKVQKFVLREQVESATLQLAVAMSVRDAAGATPTA